MRKFRVTLFDAQGVEVENDEFAIDVDAVKGSEDDSTDDDETAEKVVALVTPFVRAMSAAGLGWSVSAERQDG